MKIIDLLNKIANEEEVPTTIKYQDNYYNLIRKYNEDWEEYEVGYKNLNGGYLNIWRDNVLNDEVEIIKEEKKIEKSNLDTDKLRGKEIPRAIDYLLEDKINEIIDYLNNETK